MENFRTLRLRKESEKRGNAVLETLGGYLFSINIYQTKDGIFRVNCPKNEAMQLDRFNFNDLITEFINL